MSDPKPETHEFDFISVKQEFSEENKREFTTEIKIEVDEVPQDEYNYSIPMSSKPLVRLKKKYYEMVYLSETEMERLIEVEREQLYNGKIVYKCEHCNLGYKQQIDIKRHKTFNHNKAVPPYTCLECKQMQLTYQDLEEHWRMRHSAIHKCKFCSVMFRTSMMMRLHLTSHDLDETYKQRFPCTQCGKIFNQKVGLIAHIDGIHKKKPRFPCKLCHVVCRWEETLKKHMKQHEIKEKQPSAYCKTCDSNFASACTYYRHRTTSLKHIKPEQFKYVCDECDRRYSDKTQLRDHIEEKHLNITYKCRICDKTPKNRTGLRRHMKRAHKDFKKNNIETFNQNNTKENDT